MQGWFTAIVVGATVLAGCGGGSDSTNGELVRLHVSAGRLAFKMNEPTDSVVPVKASTLAIKRDGEGSFTSGKMETHFEVSGADLSRLESALNAIDFQEADKQLSGPTPPQLPSFSIAHDGTNVKLGEKFFDSAQGEGPPIADAMSSLLDEIEKLPPKVRRERARLRRAVQTGKPKQIFPPCHRCGAGQLPLPGSSKG